MTLVLDLVVVSLSFSEFLFFSLRIIIILFTDDNPDYALHLFRYWVILCFPWRWLPSRD